MECFICGKEIEPGSGFFIQQQPGEPDKYEHRPHCPDPPPTEG